VELLLDAIRTRTKDKVVLVSNYTQVRPAHSTSLRAFGP
jgi:hypothetical protein